MDVKTTLAPGANGTKALLKRYGDQLVCVRYRYDRHRNKRYKTAEIIVQEKDWFPNTLTRPDEPVHLEIGYDETELRELVQASGGYWNPERKAWHLLYRKAVELGLEKRIIDEEPGL